MVYDVNFLAGYTEAWHPGDYYTITISLAP